MSDSSQNSDPSKSRLVVLLPIIIAASVAIGGGFSWLYNLHVQHLAQISAASQAQREKSEDLLKNYLLPIQINLQDTKTISDQLKTMCEPNWGILESYVIRVRRDGEKKNALMFGLMTDLVAKNAQIVSFLEGYAKNGKPLVDDFATQSAAFREHAQTYGVRFRALPSYIAVGDQLPNWEPFPEKFPSAVDKEIAARNR